MKKARKNNFHQSKYHNYLRPHMGLNGKTPSEMCGVTIEGDNKWMTLIQNANRREA